MAKIPTVGEITEGALLRRVSRIFGSPPEGIVGIGDDAAVLPEPGTRIVVSTDTLVEGTHFKPQWLSPRDLGRRAMAIAASDLPAMGALPLGAVVALNLPPGLPLKDFEGLLRGMASARNMWDLPVVGGNLARSGELAMTITVWGGLSGKPFLRQGARAGHLVFVTGVPGWAHLGLTLLQGSPEEGGPGTKQALGAWIRPEPRFDAVERLRLLQPKAVLDTSDCLAQTLGHILGKDLDIDLAPPVVPKSYRDLARALGLSPEEAWFSGGEDYQLCFALRPALGKRLLEGKGLGSIPVSFVGTLKEGKGKLRTAGGELLAGKDFSHFG